MQFKTIEEIRGWRFAGNHASDCAAFNAIDDFAADEGRPIAERAEALWIMGRDGMGLDPEANLEHLSPEALVADFMKERGAR